MEVPLLSQDEFFRHLELQSVHQSAKYTYRQALKERLRASTKQESLTLPSSNGKRLKTSKNFKTNHNNNNSPTKTSPWKSSKSSCRRIIGNSSTKCRREIFDNTKSDINTLCDFETLHSNGDLNSDQETNTNSKSTNALTPLIKYLDSNEFNLSIYRNEINCYLKKYSQTVNTDIRSSIKLRRNYLLNPNEYSLKLSKEMDKIYRPKISVQKFIHPEELIKCRRIVKPGVFPLGPMIRYNPPPPSPVKNISIPPVKSIESLSKTKCYNPVVVLKKLSSDKNSEICFFCRLCERSFGSRSGAQYHIENGHFNCRLCHKTYPCALFRKSKPTLCEKCACMMKPTDTDKLFPPSKKMFKCDFCSKNFARRVEMIKHVMTHHSSQIHKIDLIKFVDRNCIGVRELEAF